jgi:hypothetical protein
VTKPPDAGQEFSSALSAYTKGAPALYQEEAQYQPMYNQLQQQMDLSNVNAYLGMVPTAQAAANQATGSAQASALQNLQTLGGQASQAALAANPYTSQMQQFSQGQLGAGFDPTLQGLYGQTMGAIPNQVAGFGQLGQQLGAGMAPINAGLGALAQQAGTDPSGAQGFLTGLRNQAAANTRTPMFQQTAGTVMGQLGTTDPLLGQMQGMAQQGLALGSTLSPEQIANATQAARAGYSARGLVQSNPAVAAEVLARDQYGQQLLASRQQFAGGVQQMGLAENQQQIANAMGLQGMDIGATQANQAFAGQLGMQIPGLQQAQIAQQAGLYGQLGANVMGQNQQQMALQQAANAAQMGGYGQAAGLQQAMLGQQTAQQTMGIQGLQYLSGLAGQGMAGVLGQQSQGFGPMIAGGLQAPTGGPSLFNSSGMLPLEAQNQMAGYNQMNQANMVNAQSKGAASGAMLGAGGAIGGALITGVAAVAL